MQNERTWHNESERKRKEMGLFSHKKKTQAKTTKYIEHAGGVIISKSLLAGDSKLKWMFREESVNPADNGWRALGDTDTQEYINDSNNMIVVDFNTLANIEPAVLSVYDLPVGADLELREENGKKYFADTNTGKVFS